MLPVVAAALVATTAGSCGNGTQAPTVEQGSRPSHDASAHAGIADALSGTLPGGDVGPPPARPVLVANNQTAEPSMYVWRVGTAVERLIPESDEAVRRNRISLGSEVLLHLCTEGVLGRLRALYYGPTEDGGPPMVEDAQTMECASTGPCRVTPVQGGYEVTGMETMELGGVLVMQIDYPSFKDADRRAGLDVYSIAWALELQP
ncbi:MAG: hypothetical protein WCA82_11650 [Jiangellales bacterium]